MLIQTEKKIWTPDNSSLLMYKAKIDEGEILVGQELYMELENLIDDIQHNDEYYYDTSDADLRMDFMQGCIRLTKSPFYGQPMILMDWQKAFIEALYSFKMARTLKDKDKVIDRFKRALLLIARKNTKSESVSALGNAEFIVGNEGSDLVCSSNDDAQASIVYDAIDTMRKLYDPEDLDTKRNQRFILNKTTNTKIFKLSDRTRNKEGRNIDWAILDECHEMITNTIAKSIEQSQSVKDNPKFIMITTEGFINEGFLDDELKKARAIIKGEDDSISASRFLPWLYTQDSEQEIFQNRRSWVKSNPTLGIVKRWDYLDEQVDLAKKSKADRIFVLSKDFNIKQNGVESWLNLEDYMYDATYDIEDLRGGFCLGHVDLAETTDLCCAKALVMKKDDKTKYIITQYFIPQSKLDVENDDHNAGAHYKEWAQKGYITICEGNDIDLTVVADWFYKLQKEKGITLFKCGYDQKFAKDWLRRMEEYNWTRQYGDVEMVLQNAQTLNNALLLVEADFKAQYINYNNNPVDRWCLQNSCLKVNDLRQALIVKTEGAKKIDGSVTLVSLYEMFRRYRSDYKKLIGG
jgi:phage terminase large subunit-like protein